MLDIVPLHYRLAIEPDLDRFEFKGRAGITFRAQRPVAAVVLHCLELTPGDCRLTFEGATAACAFEAHPEREELHVTLPRPLAGEFELEIDYTGRINDRMCGFYRSAYKAGSENRHLAVTQFQESDARRAFPCLDHPVHKAVFAIELIVPQGLTALSNQPVMDQRPEPGDRVRVRFAPTPRMSTYLVFFGVGDFEGLAPEASRPLRLWAVPPKAREGAYALAFAKQAFDLMQDYFEVPYPLAKLDLIAVPDFAFGAMENWGAMTFRENLLLHDPRVTSKGAQERLCEVVAHEIAHQWFGNLVTPADWKYLWLNESFATYFGFEVVHRIHPDWDIWEQFLYSQTHPALERDALPDTPTIEIPAGEHVVINASTAPIIYNKGASVMRQVEGLIGGASFRNGLRRFLKDHRYACAVSHDLWQALEQETTLPVARMVRGWVGQPGYPLVRVRRAQGDLLISQERFSYLEGNGRQHWDVVLDIRWFYPDGRTEARPYRLDTAAAAIPMPAGACAWYVNDHRSGFYRVDYAGRSNLAELALRAAAKTLSPINRWGLQDDLYALVKAGAMDLPAYLDFLTAYAREDAFLPLVSLAENLQHAHLVLGATHGEAIRGTILSLLDPALARIGLIPSSDEPFTRALLREALIFHLALHGAAQAEDFAWDRFQRLRQGEELPPDLLRVVLQAGAMQGDDSTREWFQARLESSDNEQERMNILAALAAFRSPDIIARVQDYILTRVPARNQFIPIVGLAANPWARPLLWDWFRREQDRFEDFHPVHFERVLVAVAAYGGMDHAPQAEAYLTDLMTRQPAMRDAVGLARARLAVHLQMRAHHAGC